jgi:hypothetical protein
MAFYTGPLYHLKGRSENVENHNKLLDNSRGLRRDSPSNDPEPSITMRHIGTARPVYHFAAYRKMVWTIRRLGVK